MVDNSWSFRDFSFGSDLILDLIGKKDSVTPFVSDFFSLDEIEKTIVRRKLHAVNRTLISSIFEKQNASLTLSGQSTVNIKLLNEDNTFTITTGHQLNVLTGPLFSIYKIAETISISTDLKKRYPQYNFVPVFWMAAEDHDFEEINHVHLFNKKITWNKPDQEQVVAGRINPKSLSAFFTELETLFQNEELVVKLKQLAAFYLESDTLSDATRKLINHLFGEFGLVIVDGNDPELKREMVPVFEKEVTGRITFNSVTKTNDALNSAGYHNQVHVRECNLFYIHADGKRERIISEQDGFRFNEKLHSLNETTGLINSNPEKFSPNALLRPVYQELLLPNLVYIGGGGEIAYWLQLNSLFGQLNIFFPMLRVRDSVFILSQKQADEIEKSGLKLNDLQKPIDVLLNELVVKKHGDSLQFADAGEDLQKAKNKIAEKVKHVDAGLVSMVEAEFSRMNAALEKIEARLIKSEKSKDENLRNKIVKLQTRLFPENHFQERHENFLAYYFNSPAFIELVISCIKAENNPHVRTLII